MPDVPQEAVDATSAPPRPCSSDGCGETAAYAITFRGQAGHVHDCVGHTAVLREWADVERVVSLPCPFPHGGIWTDTPKALAEGAAGE